MITNKKSDSVTTKQQYKSSVESKYWKLNGELADALNTLLNDRFVGQAFVNLNKRKNEKMQRKENRAYAQLIRQI